MLYILEISPSWCRITIVTSSNCGAPFPGVDKISLRIMFVIAFYGKSSSDLINGFLILSQARSIVSNRLQAI